MRDMIKLRCPECGAEAITTGRVIEQSRLTPKGGVQVRYDTGAEIRTRWVGSPIACRGCGAKMKVVRACSWCAFDSEDEICKYDCPVCDGAGQILEEQPC